MAKRKLSEEENELNEESNTQEIQFSSQKRQKISNFPSELEVNQDLEIINNKMTKITHLQALFQDCARTLDQHFQKLTIKEQRHRLNPINQKMKEITLAEFDISPEVHFAQKKFIRQYPHCQRVYSCSNFSLDLFFLPKNNIIPFHNHPHMIVVSKMVMGKARFIGYDWEGENNDFSKPHKAKRAINQVVDTNDSEEVLNLFSKEGGNIHLVQALSNCAFFDVISPIYNDERNCTYFESVPRISLEEIISNPPDEIELKEYSATEFACYGEDYVGPQVNPHFDFQKHDEEEESNINNNQSTV